MLANSSLTGLRSIDMSGSNKDRLSDTSLGISEVDDTKWALLIKDKDISVE